MVDVSRVVLAVDSRQVRNAAGDLNRMDGAGRKATSTTAQLGTAFRVLGGVISVAAIANFTRGVIRASDQMANLRGQLALVTSGQRQLNAVYDQALVLANSTGSTLDSTINLYARLARSTEELNLGQQQLFTITEAINQSFIVSGASAQESASATLQLSQGMAAGVLRGEELNSVMENSPRLARALADGLGVTIGQLRQLGADGELTSEAVTTALTKMAGSINEDFRQMPMTVERATTEMRNNLTDLFGSVDSGNAVDAVQRINKALSDPELKEAIKFLSEGMVDIGAFAVTATAKFVTFGQTVAKFAPAAIYGRAIGWFIDKVGPLVGIYEDLEEVTVSHSRVISSLATPATLKLGKAYEEMDEQMEELVEEYGRFGAKVQDVMDDLYPHEAAARQTMETYRLLERAVRDNIIAQADLDKWWKANGLQEVEVQAKRVQKEILTVTGQADPMAKAWETAMERIDTAFADAWKGAFDSFSDFADGLKNAFKQLLAELAHAAISRPILVSMGLVGGSSGAMASGGAGGISSLASIGSALKGGFSGIGSSIAGAGSSLMMGVGHGAGFLANMGIPGMNELAISAYQQGMTMTTGMALSGAAAGLAGGYLGNQLGSSLFGKNANSSIGSTIGGIGGFALGGPVGAFIGAGLGGMLDSAFGSEGNRRAGVGINTGTGSIESFGEGRNRAPMEELGQQLQAFSQAIGGSGSMLELALGNKSGFQLNGKEFANAAELVDAALDDILDTAWHLAPVVKDLAKAFDGSLEATAAYAQAMQSIWEMANQNPVRMAMQDMESANTSVMQAYRAQVSAISELVSNFDGSAGAAQNLNQALAQNQQFAYQLAVAIRQVSGQLDTMFTSSANAIREAAMTEEERVALWKDQRRDLRQSLNGLDDADAISSTAQEINRLNNLIFQTLGNPAGQAEAFASYAEKTNEIAQNQLERVLKEVERSQAEQNRDIRNGMLEAAAAQQQAANTMLSAAQQMAAAVAGLRNGGGFEVNV